MNANTSLLIKKIQDWIEKVTEHQIKTSYDRDYLSMAVCMENVSSFYMHNELNNTLNLQYILTKNIGKNYYWWWWRWE